MRNKAQKITDFDPCGQKTFYASKRMAWQDAARQNKESLGNVIKKPYKCRFCKRWHLTTVF